MSFQDLTFDQQMKRRRVALDAFSVIEDAVAALYDGQGWNQMTPDPDIRAQQFRRLEECLSKLPRRSPTWGSSYHHELRLRLSRFLETAKSGANTQDAGRLLEMDLADLRVAASEFLRTTLPVGMRARGML